MSEIGPKAGIQTFIQYRQVNVFPSSPTKTYWNCSILSPFYQKVKLIFSIFLYVFLRELRKARKDPTSSLQVDNEEDKVSWLKQELSPTSKDENKEKQKKVQLFSQFSLIYMDARFNEANCACKIQ